jgi:hypothetical protein
MIEEDEPILAAEYLATVAVALALSNLAPGCVRIERLIGRAFCNGIMRHQYIQHPVPHALRQGRIDVVVASDNNHFVPSCLVEIKREPNIPLIRADVDRMAVLIECTKPNLPDLFGFCLFPLRLFPLPSTRPDYGTPRKAELAKVTQVQSSLQKDHPLLMIDVYHSQAFAVNRPSIVAEEYDDGTIEELWDTNGFQMEPVAITIERRT